MRNDNAPIGPKPAPPPNPPTNPPVEHSSRSATREERQEGAFVHDVHCPQFNRPCNCRAEEENRSHDWYCPKVPASPPEAAAVDHLQSLIPASDMYTFAEHQCPAESHAVWNTCRHIMQERITALAGVPAVERGEVKAWAAFHIDGSAHIYQDKATTELMSRGDPVEALYTHPPPGRDAKDVALKKLLDWWWQRLEHIEPKAAELLRELLRSIAALNKEPPK
jgi:hypothetical protein